MERDAMEKYCIGIDLGGTNIKCAIFHIDFEKIGESRVPTEAHLCSETVLTRMLTGMVDLIDRAHMRKDHIRCIGIGVPGLAKRTHSPLLVKKIANPFFLISQSRETEISSERGRHTW